MAGSGKLRNIYEDNEHYNRAFLLYDKLGDRIGAMERWCKSVFAQDVIPKLNVKLADGENFRALGVGSGSGELEVHVLKQLLQTFPRISNHVVEPSAELSTKYKTFASENSSDIKGIDYHWDQLLLQDYKEKRDKEGDTTKYHFISAIHSLYYFDDLGKWLDYLYGLLAEGGVLMVIITAEHSGMAQTWRTFPGLGDKGKYGFRETSSANMTSHFEKVKKPHQNYNVEVPYDMTVVFNPEPSDEGDLLVDFISHIIDFRKDASKELVDKMMKFLRSNFKKEGDKYFYNGDWGVTVVPK